MPFGGLLTVGLIGAGTSLFNGINGANASKTAAAQQAAAALKAQSVADQNKQQGLDALQQNTTSSNDALNNLRGNLTSMFQPYTSLGDQTTGQLSTALQNPFQFNIQDDPGYQFRLNQGMKAVQQSAAAGGALGSGGALKALTQYGQGFASNEYQNAFNRHQTQLQNLFQGAGLGLQATGQNAGLQSGAVNSQVGNLANQSNLTAQILGQNSSLASQNYTGAGNAQASGIVGGANAINGALGGLGQTANQTFLLNLLSKNPGGTGATPSFNPGSGPGYGYGPMTPIDMLGTPPFLS